MAINPEETSTIRVDQLPPVNLTTASIIAHAVATDVEGVTELKQATVQEFVDLVSTAVEALGGVGFLPISVTDGQQLPAVPELPSFFLCGPGTYLNINGFADVICTGQLNAVMSLSDHWALAVEIPIVISQNITGLISAGTNITITGTGTLVDPYVINASGGGGSGVQSVTGDLVDNADSENPIILTPDLPQVLMIGNRTTYYNNDAPGDYEFSEIDKSRHVYHNTTSDLLLSAGIFDVDDVLVWDFVNTEIAPGGVPVHQGENVIINGNVVDQDIPFVVGINETGILTLKKINEDLTEEWTFRKVKADVSNGATNLGYTASPTNGIVTSDTGTDATLPLADATNAGLLKPAKYTVLENTSGTNSGDNATNSQYSGLASSKEDSANKSTSTADSASSVKFPVWSAILSYFDAARIKTLLGISTLSGSNTGDETASTLGATINGASAATPNDSDLVATVESSVVKKITWTNVKAFLKTYFDTIYTTTSAVATQITTALSGYLTTASASATYQVILTATNIGAFITGLTAKNTLVDADEAISYDSVGAVAKKTSWLNVWTNYIKAKADTVYLALSGGTLTGSLTGTDFIAGAANKHSWTGRAQITSPADGTIAFMDSSGTTFTRLQLGGTSSAFPAIQKSGSNVEFVNGNNSAYVNITYAGVRAGYVAKTANYPIVSTDYLVECTANTFTVTLPTAVGVAGKIWVIKNTGTGAITVATTSGQTIDGATSKLLSTQYSSFTVMSNGANLIIIAQI